jgi:orotidine-5'-phosphate decarboxylase
MKTFVDKLIDEIREKQSILCVGLDPQVRYIPKHILQQGYDEAEEKDGFEPTARAFVIYFEEIIKVTAPFAVIAKPQRAFYEYSYWTDWAFEEIVKICKRYGLLTLEDAKRCDGGDTSKAYADGHLGEVDVWDSVKSEIVKKPALDLDAMTVVPEIGTSCLAPFVDVVKQYGKGIFVVDKTSFTPNSEVEQLVTTSGLKVWEEIALMVQKWSVGCEGEYGINNVGVVMGATYPEDAPRMRELLPNCFFLVPGYGAQGGGADGAVKGIRPDGLGIIVNSSRGIDYAYLKEFKCDPKDFAEAARKSAEFSRNDLNQALKRAGKLPW